MIRPIEQVSDTRPRTSDFLADLDNVNIPHTEDVIMPLPGMSLSIYSAFVSLITHCVHIDSLAFASSLEKFVSLELALLAAKTNDSSRPSPPDCPDLPPCDIPHILSLGGTPSSCSSVVRSVGYNSTIDFVADSVCKRKRRSGKDDDCFDVDYDDDCTPASAAPTTSDLDLFMSRLEESRRRRLKLEQCRPDELRDSYRRLKDVLPASDSISKVGLFDRATSHIKSLEMRVQQAENQAARLRQCVHFSTLSQCSRFLLGSMRR